MLTKLFVCATHAAPTVAVFLLPLSVFLLTKPAYDVLLLLAWHKVAACALIPIARSVEQPQPFFKPFPRLTAMSALLLATSASQTSRVFLGHVSLFAKTQLWSELIELLLFFLRPQFVPLLQFVCFQFSAWLPLFVAPKAFIARNPASPFEFFFVQLRLLTVQQSKQFVQRTP